jgi:CDP-diacylglycerol--glycerol-3-phosphate 3-phosphatidyltransferase
MSGRNLHSILVNVLTFSRVPLIFAFSGLAVAAHYGKSMALATLAVVMMALAGITDLYDGILARKWNVVSTFGKLADPLMDKIFFIVAFPTLLWLIGAQGDNAFHSQLMLAFTILYILRDQWVTFLRAIASKYHADVSAMWLGKVRTALSFPAAGLVYMYLVYRSLMPACVESYCLFGVYAIEFALIGLNVYSCIVYTKQYWPYMMMAISSDKAE